MVERTSVFALSCLLFPREARKVCILEQHISYHPKKNLEDQYPLVSLTSRTLRPDKMGSHHIAVCFKRGLPLTLLGPGRSAQL